MKKYRIMCRGEDHTLWCQKNNVCETELDETIEYVKNLYPYAKIWIEEELQYIPDHDYWY